MTTPIQNAREKLAAANAKLKQAGLRVDWTLELRRYPDPEEVVGDHLDMDPTAATADRGEPEVLSIEAPKVAPLSLQAIGNAGGILMAGDIVVTLIRTAALEAFLGAPPYDELARVEFWLNGAPFRAVSARPATLTTRFTVRKQP